MLLTKPVTAEDEPFLYSLYASTRVDEMRLWGWDEPTTRIFLTMQWKAMQQSYANQYPELDQQIIMMDQSPVGRYLVSRTASFWVLVDLSLLPEHRNRGMGTVLIQKLQHEAAKSNTPLRLSVLKSNPANRLYQRLGFMSTSEDELYNYLEWTPQINRRGDTHE